MCAHAQAVSGHIEAAIDIQWFTRNPPRVGRGEKRAGEADVHDVDQLAERRALGSLVEGQVEVIEAGGRPRLERPGDIGCTRMPFGPSSWARYRAQASSAAFTGPITL